MGFRRIAERNLAIDAQFEFAFANPSKNVAGAPGELIALGGVVRETRARQENAVLRQSRRVERRDGTARLTEQREQSAARDAIDAFLERGLADRVVDDVHAFAVC